MAPEAATALSPAAPTKMSPADHVHYVGEVVAGMITRKGSYARWSRPRMAKYRA